MLFDGTQGLDEDAPLGDEIGHLGPTKVDEMTNSNVHSATLATPPMGALERWYVVE